MSWLEDMTQQLSESSGIDIASLTLTPDEIRDLLDVARIASHASGERMNAPLLTHVLGIARANGASLEELIEVVRGSA